MIPPRRAGKPTAESAQKDALLRAEYVLPTAEQTWSPDTSQEDGAKGQQAKTTAPVLDAVTSAHTQASIAKDQLVARIATMTRIGQHGLHRSLRTWAGIVVSLSAGAIIGVTLAKLVSGPSYRRAPAGSWFDAAHSTGHSTGRDRSASWALDLLGALATGLWEANNSVAGRARR